eukprot:6190698-Pleurochrysis_carterae.AAC.2
MACRYFARATFLELSLVDDEVEGEEGDERAVADVAEHNAEEKGKSDDREGRRVDLAITRHTVRLH